MTFESYRLRYIIIGGGTKIFSFLGSGIQFVLLIGFLIDYLFILNEILMQMKGLNLSYWVLQNL